MVTSRVSGSNNSFRGQQAYRVLIQAQEERTPTHRVFDLELNSRGHRSKVTVKFVRFAIDF